MPKAIRHERILALPAEMLAKVNSGLSGGRSAASLAKHLHESGLLTDVSEASLSRELRKYRRDEIDTKAAARQMAIQTSKNPVTKSRLLDRLEDFDVAGEWLKNLQAQQAKVDELQNSPLGKLPSTALRQEKELLHKMHRDFSVFMMDCGLIERVPQRLEIKAQHVVINAETFGVLLRRLQDYLYENPDRQFAGHERQILDSLSPWRAEKTQRVQHALSIMDSDSDEEERSHDVLLALGSD